MRNNIKYIISTIFFLLVFVLLINTNSFDAPKMNSVAVGDNGYLFDSDRVNYDNSTSGVSNNTVKKAVDEIYRSIQDGCYVGYIKGTSTETSYTCNKRTAPGSATIDFDSSNVKYDNSGNALTSQTVQAALNDLASRVVHCKAYHHIENETSSSYDCVVDSYTATFYYQSNSTSGSTTISNTTANCNATSNGTCTITIPSVVRSSIGTYNNAYVGLSNTTGNMNAAVASGTTTITLSEDKDYYALYRSQVTIHYPTSTSAKSSTNAIYRNQWFTSKTAMSSVVLTTTTAGTTNDYSFTSSVSGYSLYGFATTYGTNTRTYNTVALLRTSDATTAYAILYKSATATFYYSNSTAGAKTSTTASGNQYVRCTSSAAEVSNGTVSVPTLTGETAPTGTTSVGWATSASSMAVMASSDKYYVDSSYYRVYQNTLTIYRPTSTSAASSTTAYRNAYYGTSTNYTAVVSASATGTSNMTSISGLWSSATFSGYSTSVNTPTVTSGLTTVAASIKARSETTYYVIGTNSEAESSTFYYSNSATGSVTSTTVNATKQTTAYCTSTTAATTNIEHIGCSPTLTGEVAPYGTTSRGWASGVNRMATVTPTCTDGSTYYKIYQTSNINIYNPTATSGSNSCTSTTVYRNSFVQTAGDTTYTTVLGDSETGKSNVSNPTAISGYAIYGYANALGRNNKDYASVGAAATSTVTAIYATNYKSITPTFYYSNSATGGKTSVTGTATNQYVRCSTVTTAEVSDRNFTIPTLSGEVVPTGTTSIGWSTSASSMSTVTPNTADVSSGTTINYYKVYRNTLTIYRPTSASAASSTTAYRNAYYGTGTNYTIKIASSNTGTSDITSISGLMSGMTFAGYSTSVNTPTVTSGLTTVAASIKARSETTYYVIGTNSEAESSTFYYSNSNTGSVTSTTVNATKQTTAYCTSTTAATTSIEHIGCSPTLTGEVAPYGTTSRGWASGVNRMATVTPTCTDGSTYYKNYQTSNINIYNPTATSGSNSCTSTTLYRNSFIQTAGDTTYTTVLGDSETGKSNVSNPTAISGYAIYGYANALGRNNKDYASVGAAATSTVTAIYATNYKSITPTFYYSNSAEGAKTSVTGTAKNRYIRCSTVTTAEASDRNFDIPTLTGETAPYGTTSLGWATSASSMSTVTPNTADAGASSSTVNYYKVYQKTGTVTIYYPTATSGSNSCTSTTVYRNSIYGTAADNYTMRLSDTSSGTSNFTTSKVDPYSSLYGFRTTANLATREYSNVSGIAATDITTFYQIDYHSVEGTFYYNSNTSGNGTVTVATDTANGNRYLYCENTTTSKTGVGSYTIPATVTGSQGPYGQAFVSVASSTDSMTPSQSSNSQTKASANYTTLYAIYGGEVTNYYWNSSAYASRTLYRNSMFTSTSAMKTVLSTSATGKNNYTEETGPGSSAHAGFSTGADTTAEYNTVALAATSTASTLRTLYKFNITYTKGLHVSSIGTGPSSCLIYSRGSGTTGTTCSITLPSITAESGYSSVGWSTTNGATTGTAAGASYTVSTNPTALFANATANKYTVNYNDNLFTGTTQETNGVTATYTEEGSYLVLNGTPSIANFMPELWNLERRSFASGDQYKVTIKYISGTMSRTDSSKATRFVLELTSNGNQLSTRSYKTLDLPSSGEVNVTLTVDSNGATANGMQYRLSDQLAENTTFTNYKVQILVTQVHSKENVTYGGTYGTLATPTKTGYTFDGWYTSPTSSTQVTSSSTYSTVGDVTLYAKWTSHKLNIQYNGGLSDVEWCGTGSTYDMDSSQFAYRLSDSSRNIQVKAYGQYVNTSTGLPNWNSTGSICFSKTGFIAKSGAEWKLNGKSKTYDDEDLTYTAIGMANDNSCNLATTDCTIRLNVNWEGRSYTVNYYNGNGVATAGQVKLGSTTCTYGTACTLSTWAELGGVFPYSSAAHTADANVPNWGWSFYGWALHTDPTTRLYTNGQAINPTDYTATINLHSLGRKTFTFSSGYAPTETISTEYQYWNPYDLDDATYRTAVDIPNETSLTSCKWDFQGYAGGVTGATIDTVHIDSSKAGTSYKIPIDYGGNGTMRSKYKRNPPLTVSYNANGGSGTMSSTTLNQYYNSGYANSGANTASELGSNSITLATSTFTPPTGKHFDKWADGSASGTKYSEGATYTGIGSVASGTNCTKTSTTMYATWAANTYNINYNDNLFAATTQEKNGLTATYTEAGSYLTLNGTGTVGSVIPALWDFERRTINANDQYEVTIKYVSGTMTKVDSSKNFALVLELTTDGSRFSDRGTSPVSYKTFNFPASTSGASTTGTYTVPSSRATANGLQYWLYDNGAGNTTFTDYKVQILITPVHSATTSYGSTYGGTLGTLPTPTKTGYVFDGWYTSPTSSTQITSSSTYNTAGDVTLYAKWTSHKLNIQYNGGSSDADWCGTGSTYNMDSSQYAYRVSDSSRNIQTKAYGQYIHLTSGLVNWNSAGTICYTREGYTVESTKEWKLNGKNVTYDDDSLTYTAIGMASDNNCDLANLDCTIRLNVNWVGRSYTVNYYLGNATSTTGHTLLGSTSCTYGTACTLSTFSGDLEGIFPYSSAAHTANNDIINYGWSFYGWSTSADYLTRVYTDGQSINPSTYTATINLHALGRKIWRFSTGLAPTSYTIQYQYWCPRNLTSSSYRTSIDIPAYTSLTSSANGSWAFVGYGSTTTATSSSTIHFTKAEVDAGDPVQPNVKYGGTGYMRSLYSRTLTVNYNANGGSGTMSPTTLTQYYNSGYGSSDGTTNTGELLGSNSITLASNSFTPATGKQFDKWAAGSASGTKYDPGASYTGLGTTKTSSTLSTTMYATWTVTNPTRYGWSVTCVCDTAPTITFNHTDDTGNFTNSSDAISTCNSSASSVCFTGCRNRDATVTPSMVSFRNCSAHVIN